MIQKSPNAIDHNTIVDQLYDIALDPHSLETFINAWSDAGLDTSAARRTAQKIDQFDLAYKAHLKRAEMFQKRDSDNDITPDLFASLRPFDGLSAFIVDSKLQVVAANEGAKSTFEIEDGAHLKALNLPGEMQKALISSLAEVFGATTRRDCLLKVDLQGQNDLALFQIHRLAQTSANAGELALVVTTQFYWKAALGDTLEEIFKVTPAEQGVIRALVEGMNTKEISLERGTSEGTVRGQIKTILAKMNARSQSEVIRLVMSLRDISHTTQSPSTTARPLESLHPGDWLQSEVWKPFKSLVLPDGRKMDYHDMGPEKGMPILYSHMGFCMARWHKPMLKLAFQHKLRIICPIRAGYGHSDNLIEKADVLKATREDTHFLLTHLNIGRLPYVTQGNDLIFAADFAAIYPEMMSEIVGICARPSLPGDHHYSGMGRWHRFFLSTAKHAPHLLAFTTKAGLSLARRIGPPEVFRQMNKNSKADMALFDNPEVSAVMAANAALYGK